MRYAKVPLSKPQAIRYRRALNKSKPIRLRLNAQQISECKIDPNDPFSKNSIGKGYIPMVISDAQAKRMIKLKAQRGKGMELDLNGELVDNQAGGFIIPLIALATAAIASAAPIIKAVKGKGVELQKPEDSDFGVDFRAPKKSKKKPMAGGTQELLLL